MALDAENARTAWVRDAQDARTKRQGLLDHYQELRDQRQRLVNAGPEGDCPTCTRPLGAEYENVLGLLDRQMEEVVSNGNFYKQRIEQLQHEPPELDGARPAPGGSWSAICPTPPRSSAGSRRRPRRPAPLG